MKSLTYVEIDIPSFTSPPATETFRFAADTNYLPNTIEAIPSLLSVNVSPATISLGSNLGQRATVTCTFKDHRHVFNGEAYTAGSFWGKFRGRYGLKLRGMPLRIINGLLGQTLAEMDKRYFAIESTNGPDPQSSQFQIIGKDILKLADNDRAQAPVLSNGFLLADITDTDTSATLAPSGVGNAEYPASGHVAIGGKEIASFTRSGDALTLTRAQLGTLAQSHSDGDRVQVVLRYSGIAPNVIIADLLQNYADVPGSYIPTSEWATEIAGYLPSVYTATIPEPTGVNKLISEVIEQAGLAVWWDDAVQKIKLRVLRPIPTTAAIFGEDNTLEGSLQIKEQPDTRLSQVWTYFGQHDPLKPVDDSDNYRSTERLVDATAETEYNGAVIKKIHARWIAQFGRTIAQRVNNIQLGRFRDPPRRFNFAIWRRGADPISLGEGYQLQSWALQDEDGVTVDAPIQVTRLNPMEDRIEVEADEMLFQQFLPPGDLANRSIPIDSNVNNINLRTIHDNIFPLPTGSESPAVTVTCTIGSGVRVGSTTTATPAFDVGTWPSGITVVIINNGRIQGRGANGGSGGVGNQAGGPGHNGGIALWTRFAISLTNASGQVWGGGGGGGGGGGRQAVAAFAGGGGGGGAGTLVGTGGSGGPNPPSDGTAGGPGTDAAGGAGGAAGSAGTGAGGAGGNPGANGAAGSAGAGGGGGAAGTAGAAVDGTSFVTYVSSGSILGPQVN